jgi:hypothetical protein
MYILFVQDVHSRDALPCHTHTTHTEKPKDFSGTVVVQGSVLCGGRGLFWAIFGVCFRCVWLCLAVCLCFALFRFYVFSASAPAAVSSTAAVPSLFLYNHSSSKTKLVGLTQV